MDYLPKQNSAPTKPNCEIQYTCRNWRMQHVAPLLSLKKNTIVLGQPERTGLPRAADVPGRPHPAHRRLRPPRRCKSGQVFSSDHEVNICMCCVCVRIGSLSNHWTLVAFSSSWSLGGLPIQDLSILYLCNCLEMVWELHINYREKHNIQYIFTHIHIYNYVYSTIEDIYIYIWVRWVVRDPMKHMKLYIYIL